MRKVILGCLAFFLFFLLVGVLVPVFFHSGTILDRVRFGLLTMSTLGYGDVAAIGPGWVGIVCVVCVSFAALALLAALLSTVVYAMTRIVKGALHE